MNAPMPNLDQTTYGRIQQDQLRLLAALRGRSQISVNTDMLKLWVRWPVQDHSAREVIHAIEGADLFIFRKDRLYRPGKLLSDVDLPPEDQWIPLESVLFPGEMTITGESNTSLGRVRLELKQASVARPASSLRCDGAELESWVETALTVEIESLLAAMNGSSMIIRGRKLPPIAGKQKYWGDRVMIPLGYTLDPPISPANLHAAMAIRPDDLIWLDHNRLESIPNTAFEPLSRARFRLMMRKGTSSEI